MRSTRNWVPVVGIVVSLLALGYACGGSSYNPSAPVVPTPTPGGGSSTADVTITIVGMNGGQSFSPNPGSVAAGQTVAWRNADSVTHTATADNGSFNTGNIVPGATSAPITMSTSGALAYHCTQHPSMVGRVTVQ